MDQNDLKPMPEPIGKFIIEQTDIEPCAALDGSWWHFKDVVTLMKRYRDAEEAATQQEIESLKRWKQEAKILLHPIWDFAESNIKVGLGESTTDAVIKHIKEARALLEKVIDKYGHLYEWKSSLYNEIKTFLDGK